MRSATPNQLRVQIAGAGTWPITALGENLGTGSGTTLANPTEEMANAISREVGYRHNVSALFKPSSKVSAYKNLYITPNGTATAVPTGPADVNWEYGGRLDSEGSINWTARSRNDAALVPVYAGGGVEVIANLLDVSKHSVIVTMSGDRVDLALERVDGTYRWFKNLLLSLPSLNPSSGTDRYQTARIRAVGSAWDLEDLAGAVTGDPWDALFTTLNGYQLAGDVLDLEYSYLDTSKITVLDAGFTIVPVESFGQAQLIGYQLTGSGYASTEGAVVTASPAL